MLVDLDPEPAKFAVGRGCFDAPPVLAWRHRARSKAVLVSLVHRHRHKEAEERHRLVVDGDVGTDGRMVGAHFAHQYAAAERLNPEASLARHVAAIDRIPNDGGTLALLEPDRPTPRSRRQNAPPAEPGSRGARY